MVKNTIKYFSELISMRFASIRLKLKKKFGIDGRPVIMPFRGYGNNSKILVMGYVIENNGISKPIENSSIWKNMMAMWKRYLSDAIPGVKLKINILGKEAIAVTDQNGFFQVFIDIQDSFPLELKDKWHRAVITLIDDDFYHQLCDEVKANAEILILNKSDSSFGIISDVDDTILISHANNFRKKIRLMLFKNAYTRLPFEGVAAFYNALHLGPKESCHNPIFFVSSSEANLYDLLVDFCDYRKIPKGSFLLKEMRLKLFSRKEKKLKGLESHAHKLDKIRHLFEMFWHLSFVLIGDSGQHDAEIYEQVSREFPDRVLAIYIRDVRRSRVKKIKLIEHNLLEEGIDLLLSRDTSESALHALQNGFISESQYKKVCKEQKTDHLADLEI
jgi:phosphatidate phosphatase APP1